MTARLLPWLMGENSNGKESWVKRLKKKLKTPKDKKLRRK